MHLIFLSIVLIAIAVFIHQSSWTLFVLWFSSFLGALLLGYMDHETESIQQLFQRGILIISVLYSWFFTGFISLIWKLDKLWLQILAIPMTGLFTAVAFSWALPRPIFTTTFYVNVVLISILTAIIHFAAYGVLRLLRIK